MFKVGLSAKIHIDGKDYSSHIEDLNSDVIYFATPIEKGRIIYLFEGKNVNIYITHKGAVYNFGGEVLEVTTTPTPLFKVKRPEKLHKIQRRQFFRLEKKQEVEFKILDDNCKEEISQTKLAHALDISGGGLKLATEEIIPVESYLELNLKLDIEEGSKRSTEEITCFGRIVHTKKIETTKVRIYHYGVEFLSLPQDKQDKIVRFIFSEQMKLRSKGRFSNEKQE
ncbi:flagellar brake protein [Natranaerobius trueperi]|uniref:Pilus assembly protein PilZ n=1 Tax=Natranaerobius trueperi TaxID=759412 RepID=A0A226C1D5_9FIRM|nr:flagellar brake domain-containing protein [Natranaerobius trueperi]OWZ84249.1 hypothetical protein CDO51_04110 [Natranaerobius trueperi]